MAGSAIRASFVQPTIIDNVRNDMSVAQEEIFGPVISINTYEDEDEVVAIANDRSTDCPVLFTTDPSTDSKWRNVSGRGTVNEHLRHRLHPAVGGCCQCRAWVARAVPRAWRNFRDQDGAFPGARELTNYFIGRGGIKPSRPEVFSPIRENYC